MPIGRAVELDVSSVQTDVELHDRIAAAFGFPTYYGRNWDAFWDCITTMSPPPSSIHITGMKDLSDVLPRDAALLEHYLWDFTAEPDFESIEIQWR